MCGYQPGQGKEGKEEWREMNAGMRKGRERGKEELCRQVYSQRTAVPYQMQSKQLPGCWSNSLDH